MTGVVSRRGSAARVSGCKPFINCLTAACDRFLAT